MKLKLIMSLLLSTCVFAAACAKTHQTRSTEKSGFLGDYSQLTPGTGDQALLRYKNPNADFSRYTKVIIDPVKVYAAPDSNLKNLDREELQAIVDYFHSALQKELGTEFKIVTTPGPDTLRVRTALTDADSSNIALDTVSSVVPTALALSTLKRVTLGTHSFVGDAQAEMEILDSSTNTRLVAAVDKRSGTKSLTGKFDKFDDVKASIDHWTQQVKTRLAEARTAAN